MNDPFNTADWRRFTKSVREDLIPKIRDSAATLALIGGADADIKQAIEIGFSLLLDKPLIIIVLEGAELPKKLRQVADAVIEVPAGKDLTDVHQEIGETVRRVLGDEE